MYEATTAWIAAGAHEQAVLTGVIADKRATFEAKGWAVSYCCHATERGMPPALPNRRWGEAQAVVLSRFDPEAVKVLISNQP